MKCRTKYVDDFGKTCCTSVTPKIDIIVVPMFSSISQFQDILEYKPSFFVPLFILLLSGMRMETLRGTEGCALIESMNSIGVNITIIIQFINNITILVYGTLGECLTL